MFGKRGLSDVVSTVLIILLVVAAVAAVWVFIQPTLRNAGGAVERGQVCISSTVEPVSCVKNGTSGYVVSYTRSTDEKVTSLDSVRLTLEMIDGSVLNGAGLTDLSNGQSGTATIATSGNAKQVSIISGFNLADGQKQTCTSVALPC